MNERTSAQIVKLVDQAPPLTDQQRRKLTALLAPRVEVKHGR